MTSQNPVCKGARKLSEMLAYTIHLGNDKNKTKRAKELAKKNPSNTTSFSNHSIQNSGQLSKVNNHNYREYDHKTDMICNIYGTNNLINDVKNLYLQEFEKARIEYNKKQTRDDRKIDNYFNHISRNSNRDLACELIIELGDMEFWNDKDIIYRRKMTNVYKEQVYDLMQFVPEFKIANAVIHFEEQSLSPHMHIVGVPVKDGYKNGMRRQVAKSQIFTKTSLSKLQDKMRVNCIKSFNKYYEVDYKLKEKELGRNFDIPVNKMTNYRQMKKDYEKNKQKLKQANEKTDIVNTESNKLESIITTLKPNLVNKKNYTISHEQVETIKGYISKVRDTTKSIKGVNDLDIIMKEYEKDLKEHNSEVRTLNRAIIQKDFEIKELKEDLGIAKDTISSQEKEIKHLNVFKNLWNKFMKFFKNRVRYYADESYKKVYEAMKKDNILRQDDIDYIDNKNVKNKKYERW